MLSVRRLATCFVATFVLLASYLISGVSGADNVPAAAGRVGSSELARPTMMAATSVKPVVKSGRGFRITHKPTGSGGVKGVQKGRQTLIRITGPRAPQRFLFDIDVPGGAELRKSGEAIIAVDAEGSFLGAMTPPWAEDARGVDIATSLELIDDDTIAQIVQHRVVANYPVLADPWWVVPVILREGGRLIARQVVRSSSAEAARRLAARQIARQQNFSIDELLSRTPKGLKSLTAKNFRENVLRRTGWRRASIEGYQAHHTLPQKFRPFFVRAGLNIHNPIFGHWWCSRNKSHGRHAHAFNKDWQPFVDKYRDRGLPPADREQVRRSLPMSSLIRCRA